MKIVAIVQARVGSTRLPAKVLLDLGGATALERCLRRVQRFEGLAEVVVATTDLPEDDLIVAAARRLGFPSFRGSSDDVLSRYVGAARSAGADAIVRCTSDCPLLDPAISSTVVRTLTEAKGAVDYAANNLDRRLPRGLDTEIVSRDALERAHREATSPSEREHVTLHVYRRPERFRLRSVVPTPTADRSAMRWTLDTLADYRFLAAVFDELGGGAVDAGMGDVLAVLERRPELLSLNAHIEQKPV